MAAKIDTASVVTVDRCLLENKTKATAEDVFYNFQNFATGTGKWIVLAILVVGILAYLFGNATWLKRGAIGVILLSLVAAFVAVAGGLIGTNNC